eukprot:CAMPEP_0182885242 /NCGR_PEP_ID=MMETSP0034_2-20130328/19487_1 /TAXON_ID=156128 /ORGANISM="Nephroselmis pyriformis, Strain CCMP717" /LENGTH=406 /DNA_ID=CAMNT_0025018499 /DNA_START=102 /DNA_END=1319 /DNA_ORIENTATION=+
MPPPVLPRQAPKPYPGKDKEEEEGGLLGSFAWMIPAPIGVLRVLGAITVAFVVFIATVIFFGGSEVAECDVGWGRWDAMTTGTGSVMPDVGCIFRAAGRHVKRRAGAASKDRRRQRARAKNCAAKSEGCIYDLPWAGGAPGLRWGNSSIADLSGCGCVGDRFGQECLGDTYLTSKYLPTRVEALRGCHAQYSNDEGSVERLWDLMEDSFRRPAVRNCDKYSRVFEIHPSMAHDTLGLMEVLASSLSADWAQDYGPVQIGLYPFRHAPRLWPHNAHYINTTNSSAHVAAKFFERHRIHRLAGREDVCGDKTGISCMFDPLSTCDVPNATEPVHKTSVKLPRSADKVGRASGGVGYLRPLAIPDEWRHMGGFRFETQVLRHLWRPSELMKDRVRARVVAISGELGKGL